MGWRKIITTNLGDLIVPVTDEVMPIIRDPSRLYRVVSFLLSDLLTHQVHVHKARRSLGSEWRRRSLEEQKEVVELFTDLLERAYLDQIESYSGEKIQYLKERQSDNYAEVATKIVDNKTQEYLVNYRLHNVNGDWKVYDVAIEDISLVNNYRAQFNRALTRSSFEELCEAMKGKTLAAPARKAKIFRRTPVMPYSLL